MLVSSMESQLGPLQGPPSGTGRLRLSSYLGGTYAGELPCLRMREAIQLLPRVDEAFRNRCCTAVSEATDGSLRFKRKSDAQVNNKCRCLPSESRSWSRPATATGVFCNT